MTEARPHLAVTDLRARIARIESAARVAHAVLPFGEAAIDAALPGGGLALGALHEVAGGGSGAVDGAAAAMFAAGIVARLPGRVLWCVTRPDLFAPAIDQAGLHPDRVIYVEAGDEKTVLACFEEGLRHGGLAGVIAELARLSMTASRRLQLAAEASGTIGIAVRRWRRATEGGRLRPADRGDNAVASDGAALDPAPGPWRGPCPLVRRADPLPGGRVRGVRGGGMR